MPTTTNWVVGLSILLQLSVGGAFIRDALKATYIQSRIKLSLFALLLMGTAILLTYGLINTT
ncbi:hypothetical protein [Spirosoma endophyticum]|uniref:Uncharacterized protein n=1 Tax=Spirosoma endophyticum TaxID=662367 RepID=A0A1I2EQQ2_9BACT|nr:hypothetical protein [Spirosoma endophyticum]SFE95149.1 hypothetical protein SAMN05216167_1236 [Spirosoma endophyticum]